VQSPPSLIRALVIALLVSASNPALSNESRKESNFSVGIASFATSLQYDTYYGGYYGDYYGSYYDDDEANFGGYAIYGTAAINNHVAFRLTWAMQSHEDFSELDLNAIEIHLLAGTGLLRRGFKVYGSLGYFSESLEDSEFREKERFSGFMLGAGLGYDWNPISLELWVNLRDARDYEDFLDTGVSAASGGLGLAVRF
jgi:hypothetical protein